MSVERRASRGAGAGEHVLAPDPSTLDARRSPPDAHPSTLSSFPSSNRSASSTVGCPNAKPAAASARGSTR